MAVDGSLQMDLANALEGADEEGVERFQPAGVWGLDVALAEFQGEALEQPDLLLAEPQLSFGGTLFQAQQALLLSHRAMALPDSAPPPADTQTLLRRGSCSPLRAPQQGMVQDGFSIPAGT